jgi:hypothetical protein
LRKCAIQIQANRNLLVVTQIIQADDDNCPNLRGSPRELLANEQCLFELAILHDVGARLKALCHSLEGDGFLSPIAYDCWNEVLEYLRVVSDPATPVSVLWEKLPTVSILVGEDDANEEETYSMRDVQTYVLPAYNNILIDAWGRMAHTLAVMRACRLFNY